jgi:hypothetical protein
MNQKPTALILGNGPSIDQLDPALLSHFESYGSNHIYRKFSAWGRKVDNVVVTDSNRLSEIGDAYRTFSGRMYVGDQRYIFPPVQRLRRFLGRDFIPLRQLTKKSMPVNCVTRQIRWSKYLFATVFDKTRFTFDLDQGLNFGPSVVISAIQLAVIRGHRQILLTGVDSHYATPKSYFTEMVGRIGYVNETFVANPRLFMEPILVLLQLYFEPIGINLVDCTPGGALQFIPKGKLDDFVRT